MTPKPILISGAGLSSLLLAQSLLRSKIPFKIFERDASVSFRAQGYRLRLSTEGLDAIENVLGPEEFSKFFDVCGKTGGAGVKIIDAITGEEVTESKKTSGEGQKGGGNGGGALQDVSRKRDEPHLNDEADKDSPRSLASRDGKVIGISRGDMRKFFLRGLDDYIQWAHKVTGYEITATGVHAIFADGSKSEEGDMLIGGDGIYSGVARQLSPSLKVFDTGSRGIHGQASSTAFKGLGEGVWRIVDDSNPKGRMFIITNVRSGDKDDPEIQLGWTIGSAPGVINAPNDDYSLVGAPAADLAKSLTKNWHPRLRPLIDEMDVANAAFWKITCSTPTGVPEWKNEPRVTVIGDAVHSMTPAGGIGANTAVQDSALLGRLIGEAGGFKEGVTAAYEKEMRVYGSEAVKTSYGMAKSGFDIHIDENSPTV
ncbi:putative zeaxanthin epoxidase, chloroplastic [Acrodontium crateriforme]|uniref:Zeaxanthin epoxidase, chloroplastic n=1 Tax=Acrodontium crateriforme TaxID=150365 RepID=A0AAQ3MC82_9PEZI|nr:putative zeaxanthin epoxidase, chloroplastic [Acrodontium crateriforme]